MAALGQYVKPVAQITDRAKRYRANARPPKGPRVCELCGATPRNGFIVIDHRDGNEANGRRRNLRWLCQSCNVREGNRQREIGVGVRTRQFNPALFEGYELEKVAGGEQQGKIAYHIKGPRGAFFGLMRQREGDPSLMFVLNRKGRVSDFKGARWFTDRTGELRAAQVIGNPGATNLYQYTEAAYHHQRGAHDWGGAIIHDTPIEHRRKFAAEIWRRRRGLPPEKVKLNPPVKFTAKGNTVGFTSAGESITGQRLKSKAWQVTVYDPSGIARQTDTRNRRFGTKEEAESYAATLIDPAKTEQLKWWNPPRRRAGNPPPFAEAVAAYTLSHGRPPREVLDEQRSDRVRKIYFVIGEAPSLDELEIAGPECDLDAIDFSQLEPDDEIDGAIPLDFDGDGVNLAADPKGRQLYLIGGNQELDASDLRHFDTDTTKDLIALGPAISVTYWKREGRELERYRHFLGEKSAEHPIAFYDRLKKEIGLVGGRYYVKDWIYD